MVDPVSAPGGGLFIPRLVDREAPGVFAALVCAANAYGVTPYSDVVQVDGNNAPVVTVPSGNVLALACVHALRYLLAQAQECGSGAVIAFAIFKGIHSIATVVSHSDEGGYMRDVLRRKDFVAPYGAVISIASRGYMGLPVPSVTSDSTFVALVDSIAIYTAALSAVCDPLVIYDQRSYPTVSTYRAGAVVEPGANIALNDADSILAGSSHETFLALMCGDYCAMMVKQVAAAFCVTGGEEIAAEAYVTMFGAINVGNPSRHMRYQSVAPYYWIEPTGMFKCAISTDANVMGYGTAVGFAEPVSKPCFEYAIMKSGGSRSLLGVSFRSMRTNALVVHLTGHQLDGTANLLPIQFMSEKMANIGGNATAIANRTAIRGLNAYAWGKGQTTMPHPAEMLYTGSLIGMLAIHDVYDDDLNLTRMHVPTASEILNGKITFNASRLSACAPGAQGAVDAVRRRERSRAIDVLTSAAQDVGRSVTTGGETIAVGEFEPLVTVGQDDVQHGGHQPDRGAVDLMDDYEETVGPVMDHTRLHLPARVQVVRGANAHDNVADVAGDIEMAGQPDDPGALGNEANGGGAAPAPIGI